MRYAWIPSTLGCSIAAVVIACAGATGPGAALVLSTPPNASATVASVTREAGNGPEGPYAQMNVWVVIPPATAANAGIVVGDHVPVFIRIGTQPLVTADSRAITAGDQIQIWYESGPAYGVTQAPANAPAYMAAQVVIGR
jgi:hypothetical protein